MCTGKFNRLQDLPSLESPSIPNEYNVVKVHTGNGMTTYELAEYPDMILDGVTYFFTFPSKAFATLPEQTADEMNEVEKESIIM